jgi:hypothetical protein
VLLTAPPSIILLFGEDGAMGTKSRKSSPGFRLQFALRTALVIWLATGPMLGLVVLPAAQRAIAQHRARKSLEQGIQDNPSPTPAARSPALL